MPEDELKKQLSLKLLEKNVPESEIRQKVNAFVEAAKDNETMMNAIKDILNEEIVGAEDAAVSKRDEAIKQVEEEKEIVPQVTESEKKIEESNQPSLS